MLLQPNSTILFIGDSITDCGRKRPIGKGEFDQALGNGYVSLVDAALTAIYPDHAVTTLNMGISGNTVDDLAYRWKTDAIELKPDWLSILIGINDAWQQFNQLWSSIRNRNVDSFSRTLSDLVNQIKPNLKGLILITPYYLEPEHGEPMRELMDQYGAAVKEISKKQDAILIDAQREFDLIMTEVDPLQLARDRVHINLAGHMVIARAFLESIGFDWSRNLGHDTGL